MQNSPEAEKRTSKAARLKGSGKRLNVNLRAGTNPA
jgi:hypothetical protein